jgi:vanillate O-demethylase monooxygenase subunit
VSREPLRRILLDEPVVLYRTGDGTAVALEDRCCHRHYPLSDGKVVGDELQCHYHGMRYTSDGRCTFAPGTRQAPVHARVRAYPLVARHRWLWIWMGDPALADPDLIEDFHWLDDPAWGADGRVYHVQSDYRLIIENLLDLTHLTYVHDTTIGNAATANAADVSAKQEGDAVTVTRWMIDQPPPPTYQAAGNFTGNVDRWQIIEYTPPAFLRLDVGATDTGTGAPEGQRIGGIRMRNLNAITPESATSCHYFWAQAQSFAPDDAAKTEFIVGQVETAFLQDVDVFHKQQANIQTRPDAPRVNIPGDAGGVMAIKVLERLIATERRG